METITLALLLLAAVLVSSVVDQLTPKLSLPLIQIGMGVIIALFASTAIDIELEPDIFLVFFIAPLLYDEAKKADKGLLWRDRKPILSLAIGLVVVTALAIGFAVNAVIPSISLAAAFALGAALGPTDAVAVSSLSKQVDIPERQKSILKGELLLNDASGIVSFQFALAAAITGSFSLLHATGDFLIEFFGGLVFGVALGLLGNLIVRKVRAIGVENTTFHVLFEVCVPFLVYLFAGAIHVSGIIAVVVAGLVNVISPRMIGPSIARMNVVSSNVWRVLTFALNGIVFVLLGTQLPSAMRRTWADLSIGNEMLVLYVIGITAVLLGVRFLWTLAMEAVHARRGEKRKFCAADAKSALITTLCGAKGTITLSILFTIPTFVSVGERFPQRDLIIFLACGVILCTLLLATFVVPLLAPKKEPKESEIAQRERETEVYLEIIRNVIEELNARRTSENRRETQAVIKGYNDRIARVKDSHDIEDEPNVKLHIEALQWEQDLTFQLIEADEISGVVGYRYLRRLNRSQDLLRHSGEGVLSVRRWWARIKTLLRRGVRAFFESIPSIDLPATTEEMRQLQIRTSSHVIGRLEEIIASDTSPVLTEDAAQLLIEYQTTCTALRSATPSIATAIRVENRSDAVKRFAYRYELDQIQAMYEEERLSRAAAKRMRDNVYLMLMDLEETI